MGGGGQHAQETIRDVQFLGLWLAIWKEEGSSGREHATFEPDVDARLRFVLCLELRREVDGWLHICALCVCVCVCVCVHRERERERGREGGRESCCVRACMRVCDRCTIVCVRACVDVCSWTYAYRNPTAWARHHHHLLLPSSPLAHLLTFSQIRGFCAQQKRTIAAKENYFGRNTATS